MTTKDSVVNRLRRLFEDLKAAERQVDKLNRDRYVEESDRLYFKEKYETSVQACRQSIYDVLEEYESFPERFDDHMKSAQTFWSAEPKSAFHSSVFIMTKFPEPGDPESAKLETVIACTKAAIRDAGYYPRIALGKSYKDWLWSNVELHLLCCRHGVAILENRYRQELNPNVALEWGWMMGMGRDILYLRETAFDKERADWLGRTHREFDWDDPEPGVRQAIADWLLRGQQP